MFCECKKGYRNEQCSSLQNRLIAVWYCIWRGIGYLLYKRNGVQGTDSVLDVCIQCKLHICKTETYESLNTIFVLLFLFIHIFARDVCIRLEIVCLRVVRIGSHTLTRVMVVVSMFGISLDIFG